MAEDAVTIGELSRRLDSMSQRIGEQFNHVNQRLDGLQFVSKETYTVQMQAITDRLEALEDTKTWTIRALVTAILFPVIVAVIVAFAVTQ